MAAQCRRGSLPDRWWWDDDLLRQELDAHGGNSEEVHRAHPEVSARRIRDRARQLDEPTSLQRGRGARSIAEQPRFEKDGDKVTIVTEPSPELGDIADLIRERGLNPDEWDVDRVKVNEWDAYGGRDDNGDPLVVKLRQLTVHLSRRKTWDFLLPVNPDVVVGRTFEPGEPRKPTAEKPLLVWVGGDQQAPYHDGKLHQAVCLWLRDVQPDEMVLTGDTTDMPTISRHDDRPHWNATPQECADAAYVLLYDYCLMAPDARKRKLRGNHDWRIESEMLKRAERMFGLRPAKLPDEEPEPPLYSIRRLLRLDELGIELVGREGDKWELSEAEVCPGLVVRHKPPSQMNLARLNRSIMAGDTHKQRVTVVTVRDVAGEWVQRTVVEVGMLGQLDLGYAADVNWQQGFATAAVYQDGSIAYDLAKWDGEKLIWRGEVWKP